MKCTTVLHGGVRHRSSTPHESGNKTKKKKNIHTKIVYNILISMHLHETCLHNFLLTNLESVLF